MPDDPKPLSQEEVAALEIQAAEEGLLYNALTMRRALLTVRDRERQRDETLESFNMTVKVAAEIGELQRQLTGESKALKHVQNLYEQTKSQLAEARKVLDNAMRLLRELGFWKDNPNHPIWKNYEAIDAAREADSTKYSTKASSPSKGDTETSTRTNG